MELNETTAFFQAWIVLDGFSKARTSYEEAMEKIWCQASGFLDPF
jgi:hypothetical protein